MSVRPSRDRGGDGGFMLVELVVAMVLLMAISVAVIGVIMSAQSQSVSNRNRVAAANLAARELDLVRQEFRQSDDAPLNLANAGMVVDPHALAGGTDGQPLVVDGTAYTVSRSAQWNITGTGSSACQGGTLVSYPSLNVTVTVTWPKMGTVKPVVNSTSLAPGKNNGVGGTDSFIAAQVVDQAGAPISGVKVDALGGTTATGYTDASGCAVVRVTPDPSAGTTYSIKVADASYVDLSDKQFPTKSSGILKAGTLYSSAKFQVAKSGTVTVRLVNDAGQLLPDAQVNGSTVTLEASQYGGASGAMPRTVTGATTVYTNLWPTTYSAYFGTTAPSGLTLTQLDPGGSLTLDVKVAMASVVVTNLPVGTTSVVVAPAGAGCASGTAYAGTTGASFSVLPGSYDLFITGTGFSCSPGPAAQAFDSDGENDVAWATTKLAFGKVPSGGKLWAMQSATGSPSCPAAVGTAIAIEDARNGGVNLPAGSWFVWQTDGNANGTCFGVPGASVNPINLTYGQTASRDWSAMLVLNKVPSGNYLVVSTSTLACTSTTKLPIAGGSTLVSPAATAAGQALSIPVDRPGGTLTTTYNAYLFTATSCVRAPGTYQVTAATNQLGPLDATTTGQVSK